MAEFRFQIIKKVGTLETNARSGWAKEVNIISWNDSEPKYDIREWSPDHQKMSKGITLTREETTKLMRFLADEFRREL